jgi:multidrug efflux system membrane fusion protein
MRKWPVIGVLLLGVVVAVYFGTIGSLPFMAKSAAPRPPAVRVPVSAAEVQRMDVPVYLDGIGTVQAFNSVVVKSRVDGQIVKIDFSEGKEVHAGDVLVEIDPRPFEGSLEQAKANKLKDEALLANARLDLGRADQLTAAGHGSKQQLDTARALVSQLEATGKADEAMIDMAQTQLSYSQIKSPIDGRAGTRLVDAGNIVHATDNGGVVSINQLQPIFVNFSLPAVSLPPIRRMPMAAISPPARFPSSTTRSTLRPAPSPSRRRSPTTKKSFGPGSSSMFGLNSKWPTTSLRYR